MLRSPYAFIVGMSVFLGIFILVQGPSLASGQADSEDATLVRDTLQQPQCSLLPMSSSEYSDLLSVYEARDYSRFWVLDGKPNDRAVLLSSELKRSIVHGLKPEFYSVESLEKLAAKNDPADLACFEVMLSTALILYANDIANGHVRSEGSREHTIVEPLVYRADEIFSEANSAEKLQGFLGSLLTTDDRYIRLITKLAEFLKLEKLGAWPEIRNIGSSGKPKIDADKLKNLLIYTGDLSPGDLIGSNKKSKIISEAITSFQGRHGIPPTGKIDKATFDEMAMPLSRRIALILINLERRRWQHTDLGSEYVYINVADQSVRFVRNGKKSGSTHHLPSADQASLPTFTAKVDALRLDADRNLVLEMVVDGSAGDLSPSFTLKGDAAKNLAALMGDDAATIELSVGEKVSLPSPVNAYVTYLTVWANKNGTINFRPDRYNRDSDLAELMDISRQ